MRSYAWMLAALAALAAFGPAEAIGRDRGHFGPAALTRSASLSALAQAHADDMARRRSLDHKGFHSERGPAGAMAENVGYGCRTEQCAIARWMKSPPHRRNMHLPGARSYGIGSAEGLSPRGRPTIYWAMEIGP